MLTRLNLAALNAIDSFRRCRGVHLRVRYMNSQWQPSLLHALGALEKSSMTVATKPA